MLMLQGARAFDGANAGVGLWEVSFIQRECGIPLAQPHFSIWQDR